MSAKQYDTSTTDVKKTLSSSVTKSNNDTSTDSSSTTKVHKKYNQDQTYEFGGPIGCVAIMIFSHLIIPYFYLCLNHNNANVILPSTFTLDGIITWITTLCSDYVKYAAPTLYAVQIYWVFLISQMIQAVILPGVTMLGLPIKSEGNKRYTYLCNAYANMFFTGISLYLLHVYNIFRITEIFDNLGALTSVSIISSDLIALGVYLYGKYGGGAAEDITHNTIYDFFMGTVLNPRIGALDIKMFAEVRVSWVMLTILAISAAVKQYETYGYCTYNMLFINMAYFIYSNSIFKGEHMIPSSWDIFHEKWGWMLCYWNLAGVGILYSLQANYAYVTTTTKEHFSIYYYLVLTVIYLCAYYVFDTANQQKCALRNRAYAKRPWTFPQFKFGVLENPKVLETKAGTPLLVDGWYKYARKCHYTSDVVQMLCWAASCGFTHFCPWFHIIFFTGMILHRVARDEARMKAKYQEDWDRYVETVPYRFIPYVY